ncbi:MAG: hypothetical protein HC850_12400 [Rhodomicrobium sp.]|nr:hypothetical protein [Rhodomicrobium sp.]
MLLRLWGYVFLCVALAALGYDGTRMIADNGRIAFTSLEQYWFMINAGSLEAARTAIEGVSPYSGSPLFAAIVILPGWAVMGGLGTLVYLAGYRPPRPSIPDGI